jgi:hypothetical protein
MGEVGSTQGKCSQKLTKKTKSQYKLIFETPIHRWKDDIKMDLKGRGYQNFVQWRVLMKTVNLQFPYETGVVLHHLSDYQLLKNSSTIPRWARG